jgi:hypothetical protein
MDISVRFTKVQLVLAAVLFALAAAMPTYLGWRTSVSPSMRLEDQVNEATILFEADRTAVYTPGECINLRWSVEGIREVYLLPNPVTGHEEQPWCSQYGAVFGVPTLRVVFRDGSERIYPIAIEVLSQQLYSTQLPLLLAGIVVLSWNIRFPLVGRIWLSAFSDDKGLHGGLIAIFLAIHVLLWTNINRHNPTIAYDSGMHHRYVDVLSQMRLPNREETESFFSPPLPYVIPAISKAIADPNCPSVQMDDCGWNVRKVGQLQNLALSLLTLYFVLALAERIRPGNVSHKTAALVFVGFLPVYMKSMSMLRGEAFIMTITLFLVVQLSNMLPLKQMPTRRDMIVVGIAFGLLVLSRQWSLFVIVAIVSWCLFMLAQVKLLNEKAIRWGIGALLIGFVIGGWFYLSLWMRFGSPFQFNRDPVSADNETVTWGLDLDALFNRPYGLTFRNDVLPKFYTEIWGDYEGYWFQSHRYPMADPWIRYAGLVNLVAIIPTLTLLGGVGVGMHALWRFTREDDPKNALLILCAGIAVFSLIGYIWFLSSYPPTYGDTIKATYMLQIFPFTALLTAEALERLRNRSGIVYSSVIVLNVLVLIVGFPMLVTRNTIL